MHVPAALRPVRACLSGSTLQQQTSPAPLTQHAPDRVAREPDIMGAITSWAKQHSMAQVLEAMKAARVPAGPILSTAQLMRESQYQQRGMIEAAPVLSTGASFTMPAILPVMQVRVVWAWWVWWVWCSRVRAHAVGHARALPWRVQCHALLCCLCCERAVHRDVPSLAQGTPGKSLWAGPELGQHTEEVLQRELGYSHKHVQHLRAIGAV
jgi:crotonobetainyl-CoA:carnitine CoA-transferase CaiB-like acyl-CoA transferase